MYKTLLNCIPIVRGAWIYFTNALGRRSDDLARHLGMLFVLVPVHQRILAPMKLRDWEDSESFANEVCSYVVEATESLELSFS